MLNLNLQKIYLLVFCVFCLGACRGRGDKGQEDQSKVRISQLGVSLDIPKEFKILSGEEELKVFESYNATIPEAEPFKVSPILGFRDLEGKAVMVISMLEFIDKGEAAINPMSNIYAYQKNLETYFGGGEISYEEISSKEISLLIMAMLFEENGQEIALLKGLCYKYPEYFFMLDLYAQKTLVTEDDAAKYRDMFLSLNIY
jgi:hypothetical protein